MDIELTDAIKDCSVRTNVWTTVYFNERARDLEKKKDDFFDMVSLLIERCKSSENEQNADIIDNCELFRMRIVTLWTEFMNLDLVESPISDFEKHDVEQEALEIVETVNAFDSDILTIGSSGVKYNASAHNDVNTDSLSNLNEN